MDNNDVLIRLRYALDIKDIDMVEIFKHGGIEVTKEEVKKMLVKTNDHYHDEANSHDDIVIEENYNCTNDMLESFLDGYIIFKRGKHESTIEKPIKHIQATKIGESINNDVMKKLKIALSLTSEDVLDILKLAGLSISKGELSAIFRREGHKNYKVCGDKYTRNFLKGLAIKYRD